jgi:hypothetical protein
VARNDGLEVVFDGTSGGVRSVINRRTGQRLVGELAGPPVPWLMTAQEGTETQPGEEFSSQGFGFEIVGGGRGAWLRWETGVVGQRVEVEAVLDRDGDLELWPVVVNDRTGRPPRLFRYPLLHELAALSADGADDHLMYPGTTGWLLNTPFDQSVPPRGEGARVYPDGFAGNTMQVMGYFEKDSGGFYFACHDPYSTRKFLRFDQSEWAFEHENWDLRAGAGMDLDYPIVIGALARGDWYEVAEHYRGWAIGQAPWSQGGPKWKRSDEEFPRWLHEEVGVVVWGAPSGVDWSPWYRFYAEAAGTPIQVVPGWDWSATRPWQLGFEGYFPANFHPANVEAWQGHRVTPYTNNLFISQSAEGFETVWQPHRLEPPVPFRMAPFSQTAPPDATSGESDPRVLGDVFYFLCPVTEPQKNLHVWRDRTLATQIRIDGLTYDISFGNPGAWMTCLAGGHGHPPGAGRWIIDHYAQNAMMSRAAMTEEMGRYPALGTENIIESIIDVVDYQQSRIVAGPQTTFEGRATTARDPYERPPGEGLELIPFFEAVYHDRGPVIHDGWGQLSKQHGEIFYWIASRVVLQWGGLYELNYEYGWPEALPDHTGEPLATFTPYDGGYYATDDPPELDPDKVAFVGQIAKLRTGIGNPWLGYGRLARPTGAAEATPMITLDFAHTHDWWRASRDITGAWDVYQLMEAAWFDPRERLGLFFINLAKDGDLPLEVDIDAGQHWDADLRGQRIRLSTVDSERSIGRVRGNNRVQFSLDLPPRTIHLITIDQRKH